MKRLVPLAVVSAVLLLPQTASAWTIGTPCAGSTLQSCVDFQLVETGGSSGAWTYAFKVTYSSSLAADAGVVTAVGIYDLKGTPDYDFSNVAVTQTPSGKVWDGADEEHCHLTGDAVGKQLFEGCADASPPPTANGLLVGESVTFSFTSNLRITESSFTEANGLGARAHIQSFGDRDCSFKLDTRIDGQFSGPGYPIDECGSPGTSVPEPASMLLLGSGLFGVGMIARRRRNGAEIEKA